MASDDSRSASPDAFSEDGPGEPSVPTPAPSQPAAAPAPPQPYSPPPPTSVPDGAVVSAVRAVLSEHLPEMLPEAERIVASHDGPPRELFAALADMCVAAGRPAAPTTIATQTDSYPPTRRSSDAARNPPPQSRRTSARSDATRDPPPLSVHTSARSARADPTPALPAWVLQPPGHAGRLRGGDAVTLTPEAAPCPALGPGQQGVIIESDTSDLPYRVRGPGGTAWVGRSELVAVQARSRWSWSEAGHCSRQLSPSRGRPQRGY
eukprot:TRINITY_DN36432_c0_g1_i1.p1 TRINITY_DN36432_c0_g1~~TRINITY_DN36432_c0_g1_i1.p1  ORF type:complete len:264 (+),score=52.52 TRINITY_DN36432_c0_g1_i1:53-844(+)